MSSSFSSTSCWLQQWQWALLHFNQPTLTDEWLKRSSWWCRENQLTSSAAIVPSTTLAIVASPSLPSSSNIAQHKAVLVTVVPATTITGLTGILPWDADSLHCRPSACLSVFISWAASNLILLLFRPGVVAVATHVISCLLGNRSQVYKAVWQVW